MAVLQKFIKYDESKYTPMQISPFNNQMLDPTRDSTQMVHKGKDF